MVTQIISFPVRLLGLALGMATVACQGSDLTLPPDGSPASLRAVSGDGQRGTVGTQLPESLVVRLTDGAARPVRQASLRFQTVVPAAAEIMPAAVVVTDDSGYAWVWVRLGATEGTQTVEALLADIPASEIRTTFGMTALADQPPDDGGDGGGGDDHGGGSPGNDDHGHGGDKHDHGHGHDHHEDGD